MEKCYIPYVHTPPNPGIQRWSLIKNGQRNKTFQYQTYSKKQNGENSIITCLHLELGLAAIVNTTVAARPTTNGVEPKLICATTSTNTKSGGVCWTFHFQELQSYYA